MKSKTVSRLSGSYLGFLEFDHKRYWDARDAETFNLIKPPLILPSDSRYRPDLCALAAGNLEEAQKNKEILEELQRADAKLRTDFEKQQQKAKK